MTQWYDINYAQWVDSPSYGWYTGASGTIIAILNGFCSDDRYVYTAFSDGVGFVDINTEESIAKIQYNLGINSVAVDESRVYLATSLGIKYLYIDDISSTISLSNLHDLNYSIPSQTINYLHYANNHLICCTALGISIIKFVDQDVISSAVSGTKKCFAAANNRYYYTASGTSNWSLNRIEGDFYDWSIPNYIYNTNSGILSPSTIINDLYVTTSTSERNKWFNTLFVATDLNVYVIDEGTNNYKSVVDLDSTYSGSEFISVWADDYATYNSGQVYFVSRFMGNDKLSIMDLNNGVIRDYYTTLHVGRLGETLVSDNIIDLNVRGN